MIFADRLVKCERYRFDLVAQQIQSKRSKSRRFKKYMKSNLLQLI